jgi:hypothetical protein
VDERAARLCTAIRRYLASHPDAADSPIGIRDWWLGDLGIEFSAADLSLALDQLVKAGALQLTQLAGGTDLYSAPARSGQDDPAV